MLRRYAYVVIGEVAATIVQYRLRRDATRGTHCSAGSADRRNGHVCVLATEISGNEPLKR